MELKEKPCLQCGEADKSKFNKRTSGSEGLQSYCKACQALQRVTDPTKLRMYHQTYIAKFGTTKRARLGVTTEDFARMIEEQHGLCALCFKPLIFVKGPAGPALDHDHETQKVRGVVHASCNKAIGFLGDDPVMARLAAEYLEKHAYQTSIVGV